MDEIKGSASVHGGYAEQTKGTGTCFKDAEHGGSPKYYCSRTGRDAEPEPGGNEDSSEHNAGSFIVKTALKYMEENYTQKITLAEVAEKTYVSQWHLSKR